jgi:hypothetical protein
MAANAKYTPAPTQDPDETTWAQAPPSYQAADEASSSSAGPYGTAPRSSEDNIPDDFKFGGSVAEATIDIRNQFIRKGEQLSIYSRDACYLPCRPRGEHSLILYAAL